MERDGLVYDHAIVSMVQGSIRRMQKRRAFWQKVKEWLLNSELLYSFFHPEDEYTRIINHPITKALTPDQLITANLIELIAKDFDGWTVDDKSDIKYGCSLSAYETSKKWEAAHPELNNIEHSFVDKVLIYAKKNIKLFYYSESSIYYYIGDVKFDNKCGAKIREAYNEIWTERQRLKKVAAEALKKMKEDQKKWDLAEKLTGLKRLENGALVPATPISSQSEQVGENAAVKYVATGEAIYNITKGQTIWVTQSQCVSTDNTKDCQVR